MEKVDNALVLAIAICIVRNKPSEQSLASYILDLREKFPLQPEKVPTRAEQDQWRIRALALEKENESLKLRLQKHEIELLAAKTSKQTDNPSSSQASAPKKKRKVESKATVADPTSLRRLLDELVVTSGPGLPLLRDSFDILSSFHTLKNTNTNGISEMGEFNTETVLIPNVKRSLKALGKLLDALLFRNGPTIFRSTSIHVADSFRELLLSLLRSTFPLAPRCAVLSDIMEELCLGILRPIIQGFHLTSTKIFESSTSDEKNKEAEVDTRPSMLRAIQQLLECLHSLGGGAREIREFLVLETAREISCLWGKKSISETAGTLNEGLRRLARKDSLWYHCAIINLALEDLPQRPIEDNGSTTLAVMAADLLYDLPRLFEEEDPVDVMAEGMVLAVVEKAWLKGLCICDAEEEADTAEGISERTEENSTMHEFSSSYL